jgi:hypothetical protein
MKDQGVAKQILGMEIHRDMKYGKILVMLNGDKQFVG